MPEEAYTIQCITCKGEFPKVVQVKADKNAPGPRSFEVSCPFCGEELTVKIDQPLALNSFVLRSLKKEA